MGPEGVRAVLRRQWAPLVEGAPDRLRALPLAERAQLVAEFRSSQGYMAEATMIAPGVARIREHHCALRDVAERFPELCAAEQELLEELLGVPLERTCHIPTGCSSCAYTAREPAPDTSARPAGRAPDSEVRPVPSPSLDTV
jgi:DeoR family suf operon transcriptional repressor